MNNQVTVTLENGTKAIINVLDIIESFVFGKKFILYTFEGENKTLFASVLNELEDSYSLNEIVNEDEINYINSEIDRVVMGDNYGL